MVFIEILHEMYFIFTMLVTFIHALNSLAPQEPMVLYNSTGPIIYI
jgi:hypothetical protein